MKNLKICVIRQSTSKAPDAHVLTFNLLQILKPLADDIFVITGNFPEDAVSTKKIHIINVNSRDNKRNSELSKYLNFVADFILTQLKFSHTMIKISKDVDIVIFFIGILFLLPMLFAKLLRKKTIIIATGSFSKGVKTTTRKSLFGYSGIILGYIYGILEKINYVLSDMIVVYTGNLIQFLGLEKHRNKILVAHRHFMDFDKFKMKKKFDERENLIGYIGRLSEEKGVLNFVKAIPKISKERREIKFLIGGEGYLRDKIEEYLDEKNLNNKVKLASWIPHDKVADYLNELKLVVLPSYTEGLPNVMLEAMACGTPVLATPVGGVPDVIKDGVTGFILEDNSPECIAENVVRVLNYPNLDEIVKNARELIEKGYTYEAAVERYREILGSI